MMLGPYGEERARGEAANYPGGFAVGFASSADRGDFLRRYEDGWRPGAAPASAPAPAEDLTAAMCRESTAGWDGRPDGPDACGCDVPRPVAFYGRMVCQGCDGDLPEACPVCGDVLVWGAGPSCPGGCEL